MGIYTGCDFSSNIDLNHAVQLVGYGTDAELGDYWLGRNSWGSGWGEGATSGCRDRLKPSVGQTPAPWMGQHVRGDLAMMSSMCVGSVEFSLIYHTLWGLMTLLCPNPAPVVGGKVCDMFLFDKRIQNK